MSFEIPIARYTYIYISHNARNNNMQGLLRKNTYLLLLLLDISYVIYIF